MIFWRVMLRLYLKLFLLPRPHVKRYKCKTTSQKVTCQSRDYVSHFPSEWTENLMVGYYVYNGQKI